MLTEGWFLQVLLKNMLLVVIRRRGSSNEYPQLVFLWTSNHQYLLIITKSTLSAVLLNKDPNKSLEFCCYPDT